MGTSVTAVHVELLPLQRRVCISNYSSLFNADMSAQHVIFVVRSIEGFVISTPPVTKSLVTLTLLLSSLFLPFTISQAKDIMSNYQTGVLENSAKMLLLFHLIDESVRRRDKILVFR